MELTYSCRQCGAGNGVPDAEERTVLTCSLCDYVGLLPLDWAREGEVAVCPICGGQELFRHRNFHQKACFLLLLAGAVLAIVTRFVSVVLAALASVVLYVRAPERLVCYRCHSRIRGHAPSNAHGRYDPRVEAEVKERCARPDLPKNSRRERL